MGILIAMDTSSSQSLTTDALGEKQHAEVKTPRGIILKQSQVVDGLGAWSSLPIVEGGLFGPFAGDDVGNDEKEDKAYTWKVYDACTKELLQVVNGTDAVGASWMRYIRNARFLEEQNMISTQVGNQVFYKAIKDISPDEELLTFLGHAEPQNQQMETEDKISKKRVRRLKRGEEDNDDDKQETITMKFKKVKKENVSASKSPLSRSASERSMSASPVSKMEKDEKLPMDDDSDREKDESSGVRQETSVPSTRQLTNKQNKDDNKDGDDEEFYYFFETRLVNVIESKGTKLYKCDVCKGIYHYAFSLKRHFLRNHINWKYLSEADISNCMINVVQQDMVTKRQPVPSSSGRRSKMNSSSAANNRASSKPHFVSNSVSHSELYRCSLCSELFDYMEDLAEHTNHHMTSPPSVTPMVPVKTQLVCSTCNMKFTYKQNFIRHQAVHSGERPFQCEYCFRTFPTEISRKQHVRIHIFNTKNKSANNNNKSSGGASTTKTSNNNSTSSSSSSSLKVSTSNKVTSVPVVKQTVKVEPKTEVPTVEDLTCQICGKTFSCSSFLNKHIVCMHNGAMKRRANQNRKANHQKESVPSSSSATVKTEPVKEEVAANSATDPQALIIKALKTAKRKNQFKYTCTVCQRKFRLYIQMCKHKRAAHGKNLMAKKKTGFYDLEQTEFDDELLPGDLEAPFLESKDVAENVARNLTSYIDGNIDSLSDFTKYVNIKGYTTVHEHDPDYVKQTDVAWSQYNFPTSFQMPVEDTETPVASSTCGNNSPCLPSSLTTTSMPSDLNKDASSKCEPSSTNLPAVTNQTKASLSSDVEGKQSCTNVDPPISEKISPGKSSLLSSSSPDILNEGAPMGTSTLNSPCLQTPIKMTSNPQDICDNIPIINQSPPVIGNLSVVKLPIVSPQIPNSTLTPTTSASAVPVFIMPSTTTANLTNVPSATNLGPSVEDSNASSSSSLWKDKPPIENSSSTLSSPVQSGLGVGPIFCPSPNSGESSSPGSKPGKSVRFQSAFLVHEFCSSSSTDPNTLSSAVKEKEEIPPESSTKNCLSLNDDKLKTNSNVVAVAEPKSNNCDSNLSSRSVEDVTQDVKTSCVPLGSNSPNDSAKSSDKTLKSVQKDVLFTGPHMMTAHIHERGHVVLEFGDDKEISSKVKNNPNPPVQESPKAPFLKSHGLVKKSKKNQNLLDFSIQHIVKMRVQEYKDYISKTNPTIKWEDNPPDNKDSLMTNATCLARSPSCDLRSKLGDCLDSTCKDFNKVSAFLKSGLLPREKLPDLEKSVPSFTFGRKENLTLDYSQIEFGKHGIINFVCSVCRKHFLELDLCLRHQQHRHPSIECNFLEVELGNSIVPLHYPFPDPDGLLSQSTVDLSACKNLEVYTCSKCSNSFPTVTRLHSHIVRCATNSPGVSGLASNVIGKRKYKKRLKKRLRDVLNGSNTFKFRLKDFAGYDPMLFQENQVQRRRFRGCRNRKIVTVHETMKTRKRRNYDLSYDPTKHRRRRESVEVVEEQQCRGCHEKFKSISLLERHAPNCIRKDKLQNLKVLEGIRAPPPVRTGRPLHRCHYCSKQFTYLKSLYNHYRNCSLRKQQERTGSLQQEDLVIEHNMAHIERDKSLEELSSPSLSKESSDNEQHVVRKGGWPKGQKRKFRRKNHSWTSIKRKRLKDSEYADEDDDEDDDDPENTKQTEDSNDGIKKEIKTEPDVKVPEKTKACLEELLISNSSEKATKKPAELSNSSCGSIQSNSVSVSSDLKQSKPLFAYRAPTMSTEKQRKKDISESELYKQLTKNNATPSGDVDGDIIVSENTCVNPVLGPTEKNGNTEIPKQLVNDSESSKVISHQKDVLENEEPHLVIDLVSDNSAAAAAFSKSSSDDVSTVADSAAELGSTLAETEDPASAVRKEAGVSVSLEKLAKSQDSFESESTATPKMDFIPEQCSNDGRSENNVEPSDQQDTLPQSGDVVVMPLDSEPPVARDDQEARSTNQEEITMIAPGSANDPILTNQTDSLSSLPGNANPLTNDKNPNTPAAAATYSLSSLDKSRKCQLEVYGEDCQSSLLATEEMDDMPRQFETVIDIEPCEMVVESKEPVTTLLPNHVTKEEPAVSKTNIVVEDDVIKDTCKEFDVVPAKPNVVLTPQSSDTCQANVSSVEFVSHVTEETATKPIQNDDHLTQLPAQVILSSNQLKPFQSQMTLSNAQLHQVPTQMALSHPQLLQLQAQVTTLQNAQLLQLPAQVALPGTQMSLSNVQLAQLPTQMALSNTQLTQIPTHLTALPTHVALSNAQLPTHLTLSNTHMAQLPTQVTLSNTQLTQLPTQVTHLTQIPTQVILSNAQLTQLATEMPSILNAQHLTTRTQVQVIPSNAELSKAGTKLIWPQAELVQPNIKLSQPQVVSNPNMTCPRTDVTLTNAVSCQVNRDLPQQQTETNLPNVELNRARMKVIPSQVEMNLKKTGLSQSNTVLIQPQTSVTQANAKLTWPLNQRTLSNAQLVGSNVKFSLIQGDSKQIDAVINQPLRQVVVPAPNIDLPSSEVKVTNVNSSHLQRDSLTQTNAKLKASPTEQDAPNSEISGQQIKVTAPTMDSMQCKDKVTGPPTKLTPLNKLCQASISATRVESLKNDASSSFTKNDSNILNDPSVESVNTGQLGNSAAVPPCEQVAVTSTNALFSTVNETTVTDGELTRLEKLKENLDVMEAEVDKSSSTSDVEDISKTSEPVQDFEEPQPQMAMLGGGRSLNANSSSVPENSGSETEFTPLTSLNFESELELEVVPEAIMEGDILYEDFPPTSCVAITNSTSTSLETPPDCRKSLPVSAVSLLNSQSLKLMPPVLPFSSSVPITDLVNYNPSVGSERNNYVLCIVPPEFQMPSTSMQYNSKCQPFVSCEDAVAANQLLEVVNCQHTNPECDSVTTPAAVVTESDTSSRDIIHLPQNPTNANNLNIQQQ